VPCPRKRYNSCAQLIARHLPGSSAVAVESPYKTAKTTENRWSRLRTDRGSAIIARVFLLALWLLLSGCLTTTPPTPIVHTFSGQVVDQVNGRPVFGAVVSYGSHQATTGLDGSFTMDLGEESGTMTSVGIFVVRTRADPDGLLTHG
jgi:hypothetical protein